MHIDKNMANNPSLTVHMVVKNEDQWVWFALQSVLPYADRILVTDTGSTDHTVNLIKSISSPNIELEQVSITSPQELTDIRQRQINLTKTDWIWVVDGDEVYPKKTAEEVVHATNLNYEGIVVRRYDLMGDVYHRQIETVGQYNLFGQKGHLVSRLFNKKKIKGLYVAGNYPLESYYGGNDVPTRNRDSSNWYITNNYLYHAMYLKRSSSGSNLAFVINRSKYKVEKGIKIDDVLPEVFDYPHPTLIPDPRAVRSQVYELAASIITPIKNLKRYVDLAL